MTPPAISPLRPEIVTRGMRSRRQAWIERATSADHKTVGLMYLATALSILALAATELVLMRLQLLVPENGLIQPEIFNRLLSASSLTFVVLTLVPLALGLIGCLAPLQIGARGVALPRLNQLSYWLYLVGAVTVYASFLYAAPELGTLGLPPLSASEFTPLNGADAWIAGAALAILGFICFAVNLIVTMNRMRAPGIAWRRMAPFSWAATLVGWLLLVLGPLMLAALVMLEIDRRFDGVFFVPGEGGAPLLYEHLAYIFFTGVYVIVLLVAAGAISEILPTFARKPLFNHRAVLASMAAIAVLGPLAWMQNMYAAPLDAGWTIGAMAVSVALVVPIGVLFYNWIATIWGGALELRAATWYALAAIATISFGLAGELAYSVIPVGWALDNTTASQGDTLYVLAGAGVFGGFAALHYWFPKLGGRLAGEALGKAALAIAFLGLNLYVLALFFAGLEGQPVDVFKYFEELGVDGYNLVASIGAFIFAIGILAELGNLAYSWHNGLPARGHDPWRGATLEWFALSPPPPHNFDAVPDVRSAEPLHDIRESIRLRTAAFIPPAPLERPSPPPREREPAQAGADDESSSVA